MKKLTSTAPFARLVAHALVCTLFTPWFANAQESGAPNPAPASAPAPAAPQPLSDQEADALTQTIETALTELAGKGKEAGPELGVSFLHAGVTVGYGFFTSTRMKALDGPTIAHGPVVTVIPAYWFKGDYLNETYCIGRFSGQMDKAMEARRVATRVMAKERLEAVLITEKGRAASAPTTLTPEVAEAWGYTQDRRLLGPHGGGNRALLAVAVIELAVAGKLDDAIRMVAETYYEPGSNEGCGLEMIGVWGAYLEPLRKTQVGASEQELTNYGAYGVAFLPNAYVSLLFGLSVYRYQPEAEMPDMDAEAANENHKFVVTPTFGLTLNGDIITSLLRVLQK